MELLCLKNLFVSVLAGLDVESELHINRHPFKGNLFENLVIIEALKYRYNQGKKNNLFFWRDAKGNEIDLLIENGPDVMPVEIKAGATISGDFFKGLRAFSSRLSELAKASALVYGGTERQRCSDASIWRMTDVAEMMSEQV